MAILTSCSGYEPFHKKRLIGDLGCKAAAPVIKRYAAVVAEAIKSGNLAPYADLVDPNTPVTPIALDLSAPCQGTFAYSCVD